MQVNNTAHNYIKYIIKFLFPMWISINLLQTTFLIPKMSSKMQACANISRFFTLLTRVNFPYEFQMNKNTTTNSIQNVSTSEFMRPHKGKSRAVGRYVHFHWILTQSTTWRTRECAKNVYIRYLVSQHNSVRKASLGCHCERLINY